MKNEQLDILIQKILNISDNETIQNLNKNRLTVINDNLINMVLKIENNDSDLSQNRK